MQSVALLSEGGGHFNVPGNMLFRGLQKPFRFRVGLALRLHNTYVRTVTKSLRETEVLRACDLKEHRA